MRKVRRLVLTGIAIGGTLFSFGCNGESSLEDNDANNVTNSTREIKLASDGSSCPKDYHVDAGASFDVPAGCQIKGDVTVNGEVIYDDNANTGLVVSCPQGCHIEAPWGANVTPRDVDDLKAELLKSGCDANGCDDVIVKIIGESTDHGKSDDKAPTPAPTKAAATPTTTRAQITPDNVPDECDFSIDQGATANVPAGCIVSGDVIVNGNVLFDNNQKTGLIVVINKASLVEAPYGAAVTAQGKNPQHTVDLIKAAMDERGCGNASRGGCDVVKVDVVN